MTFFQKLKYMFANFRAKQKISVTNPRTKEDLWYMFLSPMSVLASFLGLVILMFVIAVLVIVFTPMMDYIPGYQGNKTRNILVENNLKLDSLEAQLNVWNSYYDNISRIMDGREPLPVSAPMADSTSQSSGPVERSAADSLFRAQMEGDGEYALRSGSQPDASRAGVNMFTPIRGVISEKFDPQADMFGINIVTSENQPVMAVMEGVVIAANWTPNYGAVIYLSHPGNIISAYLHNSRLLKKTGDRVSAGEVIAFTGDFDEEVKEKGYMQFQLWYNGSPVDPENYIIF